MLADMIAPISPPANTQIWIAAGVTDMRRGFPGLSAQVQTVLEQQPLSGHVFCFRGRRGDVVKLLWHDGDGLCLFQKRLERGRFVWPQATGGKVSLTPAQLSMLLEGIDWERRITEKEMEGASPLRWRSSDPHRPRVMRGQPRGCTRSVDRGVYRPAIERRKTSQPECRCLPVGRRQHGSVRYASADRLRAVCRPWHVHTSSIREPGGLPFAVRQPGGQPHSEGRGS